jgi:hypothetical protein
MGFEPGTRLRSAGSRVRGAGPPRIESELLSDRAGGNEGLGEYYLAENQKQDYACGHEQACASTWLRPATHVLCMQCQGKAPTKNFPQFAPCNPLISRESDERIQGNPRECNTSERGVRRETAARQENPNGAATRSPRPVGTIAFSVERALSPG